MKVWTDKHTGDHVCAYCDGDAQCPAGDSSMLCTRPAGHKGKHVACCAGPKPSDHAVHTWPQEKSDDE